MGGYIPSNIWQGGGVAYEIIPPMLWKVNKILTYLYKYLVKKKTDFAQKTTDF